MGMRLSSTADYEGPHCSMFGAQHIITMNTLPTVTDEIHFYASVICAVKSSCYYTDKNCGH
jgi:hypothetical protein